MNKTEHAVKEHSEINTTTASSDGAFFWGIYIVLSPLIGFLTFIGCWIYCISTYGFLVGVGLGWIPSLIVAFILGFIWPLIVGFLIVVLLLNAPNSHDTKTYKQQDIISDYQVSKKIKTPEVSEEELIAQKKLLQKQKEDEALKLFTSTLSRSVIPPASLILSSLKLQYEEPFGFKRDPHEETARNKSKQQLLLDLANISNDKGVYKDFFYLDGRISNPSQNHTLIATQLNVKVLDCVSKCETIGELNTKLSITVPPNQSRDIYVPLTFGHVFHAKGELQLVVTATDATAYIPMEEAKEALEVATPYATSAHKIVEALPLELDPCMAGSKDTTTLLQCAKLELKTHDTKLNETYQRLLGEFKTPDQEELRKLQRLWIKHRDTNCVEGSIPSIDYTNCLIKETKIRVDELQQMLIGYTN